MSCLLGLATVASVVMGNGGSVTSEFRADLVRRYEMITRKDDYPKKKSLSVRSIQGFSVPRAVSLDLRHVPTLYRLDGDKDGRVSVDDMVAFAEFACTMDCSLLKLAGALKNACVREFVSEIHHCDGFAVTEWLIRVAEEGSGGDLDVVDRAAVERMYFLLGGKEEELEKFIDSFEREATGIPRPAVAGFARKYLQMYGALMEQAELEGDFNYLLFV